MRILFLLVAWLSVFVVTCPAEAAARDRVLLVVSGHGADNGKTRPGFEMDELSQAWLVFADNGFDVEIASPAGGAVVADPYQAAKPYNRRFLDTPEAAARLKATQPIATLRDRRYAAVFVIGGKGAMFDLPVSADLKTLIAATWAAGGVVGAVCHGPAVLMNLALADGTSLIAGRRVTGFSNEEEALFGKGWAPSFPVLLEDGLRGAGGRFSAAPMMLPHVVTDARLVTGQNPFSTAAAAEAVIRAMGRTPAPRELWADERTMNLVSELAGGDAAMARAAFNANPRLHDARLLAAWGVFRAQSAGADRTALAQAVDAMELATPHVARPELAAALSAARTKLAAAR
jgi:putative intracellular protease/amidase